MSSTSNVQNLLTNVFRPTFVFNTATSNYQTKLELVNIDTVSANAVTTYAANVGDASGNVYVGVGAGNAHATLVTSGNTTDTFLGTGAGGVSSNVKNSVFLGYRAGYGVSNSSNSISIGANTLNGGNSNIYIGCATGIATGSNNIFLGPGVSNGGTSVSNTLLIGSGSNTAIVGDLAHSRIGISTSVLPDPSTYIVLDVNGFTRIGGAGNIGKLGINVVPSAYTFEVNGNLRASDGYGDLIVTHDSNSNATMTFSNIRSANCNATIQATGGFFSLTGSILIAGTATSNIGLLKRGVTMIYASSDNGTSAIFSARTFSVAISNSGAYAAGTMSSVNSGAIISNSSSNITLSNGAATPLTYTYSITYFPSP